MRGRPRKAQLNTLVQLRDGGHGVIVDYRNWVPSWRYGVVRTDGLGRNPRGPMIWYDSTEFTPTGKISRKPGRIYRRNQKEQDRGCACQCCPHVKGWADEPEG